LTSGGINFNDYPENQLTKFRAVYTVNTNRVGATDIKMVRQKRGECRRHENEGALGADPLPADYGVWGSVVSSPSGVRGGSPAENDFGAF